MFAELNAAIAVAKHLREVQGRLKDTEFASLLSDLQLALADVKLRCAQAEEDTRQAEAKVRELEEKLAQRGKLTFRKSVYYMEGDEVPFCKLCYERDSKLLHLDGPHHSDANESYFCKNCKQNFYTIYHPKPPREPVGRRDNWVTRGGLL